MTIRIPGNIYRSTEHEEQVALMEWAALQRTTYPELDLLFAIPNGGKRHISTAKKLKAEGVKPGVPDLFLPVARGICFGLFLELKRKDGSLTKEQRSWCVALAEQGYSTVVCYGWEAAAKTIETYLKVARSFTPPPSNEVKGVK